MSQRDRDFSSEDRLIQNEEEAEGEMSQEIAILGTGAVGSSLGGDLIEAGYGSVHPGNGAWANLDKEGLCLQERILELSRPVSSDTIG